MNSFEINKIVGAVLGSILLALVLGYLADALVHPKMLQQNAYVIDVSETASAAAAPSEEEAGLEPVGPMLASADVAAGQKLFKKCAACHTVDDGGANKVGPNLYDIVGGDIGRDSGFGYSKAMSEMEGPWDYEVLNGFLASPKTYLPGTKMTFAGLKKPSDRANMIAYLRSLSASPQPLP